MNLAIGGVTSGLLVFLNCIEGGSEGLPAPPELLIGPANGSAVMATSLSFGLEDGFNVICPSITSVSCSNELEEPRPRIKLSATAFRDTSGVFSGCLPMDSAVFRAGPGS